MSNIFDIHNNFIFGAFALFNLIDLSTHTNANFNGFENIYNYLITFDDINRKIHLQMKALKKAQRSF